MFDRLSSGMQTGFLVLAASFIGSMGLPGIYLAAVTAWTRNLISRYILPADGLLSGAIHPIRAVSMLLQCESPFLSFPSCSCRAENPDQTHEAPQFAFPGCAELATNSHVCMEMQAKARVQCRGMSWACE